jgi:hypothetical protein
VAEERVFSTSTDRPLGRGDADEEFAERGDRVDAFGRL